MRLKIILSIIAVEIIVVLLFAIVINNKKNTPNLYLSPLKVENISINSVDNLKYFTESKPNDIIASDLSNAGLPNYKYKISINSDGFNQLSNYPATKSAGVYRIVTIGDSFTYGSMVNTEDNYPSQLESFLNKNLKCKNISSFQVINLGMPGYDFLYTIERYKLRGQRYNPDLVLWYIIGDDFRRYNEKLIPEEQKLEIELKRSGKYQELIKEGKYFYAWDQIKEQTIKQSGGEKSMLLIQEKNMENINNFYQGPLLIFTNQDDTYMDKMSINTIRDFIKNRKNTYFTTTQNIYLPHLMIPNVGHPTAAGYKLIVNNIYKYLMDKAIVSCDKY